MKKLIILLCLCGIGLIGCDANSKVAFGDTIMSILTKKDSNKIDLVFTPNTFDSTYKKYNDFDKMSVNVIAYYNEIIDAYNNSDKKTFSSFTPTHISQAEKYFKNFKYGTFMNESEYAGLWFMLKIYATQRIIAGIDLMSLAGNENEEAFIELKDSIIDAYNSYSTPISFENMPH